MVDLLYQSADIAGCAGCSALVCHGQHYIMAGEFLYGAYHPANMGGDAGSDKLFYIFMVTRYPP